MMEMMSKDLKKATSSSNNNTTTTKLTRPNLLISKSTDIRLEQLADNAKLINVNKSNDTSTGVKHLSQNIIVNTKLISSTTSQATTSKKETNLVQKQNLTDCVNELLRDYPCHHCESLEIWSNESIGSFFTKENQTSPFNLTQTETAELTKNEFNPRERRNSNCLFDIGDVGNYESPLKVFRGYRFNSNFLKANGLEETYSRFYCNSIDFRRPFCPFDLHGSCKDSNCTYQHTNVMLMDNLQRTEHLLSYCPKLLDLSSDNPSSKEATKKLKQYAKTFMTTHLNKMSIQDYFKYLYNHVIENLPSSNRTILSRIPGLCPSFSKFVGVFDNDLVKLNQDYDNLISSLSSSVEMGKKRNDDKNVSLLDQQQNKTLNSLLTLFETILKVNVSRSTQIKYIYLTANEIINIEWLNKQQQEQQEIESESNETWKLNNKEKIIVWIYYALQIAKNCETFNTTLDKILNVLSNALEVNPKCELIWLVYLKCYQCQRHGMKDYHEICMLCMDNLITYDLVWFMLTTCPGQFVYLIIEKYEKFLLQVDAHTLTNEFEQTVTINRVKSVNRVSFYLAQLILYHVYIESIMHPNKTDKEEECLFIKYLHSNEIVKKLEPNDFCFLWLNVIYERAFGYLPTSLHSTTLLATRCKRYFETQPFWRCSLHTQRLFHSKMFACIRAMYSSPSSTSFKRRYDSFLLPWNRLNHLKGSNQPCSTTIDNNNSTKTNELLDSLRSLFHEGLKILSNRCVCKLEARQHSMPLFINLINLEVANKRYEVATKLCERLLKGAASDRNMTKELWLSQLYIQRFPNKNGDKLLVNILDLFKNDAQIIFIATQYYSALPLASRSPSSVDVKTKNERLIENFIINFYYDNKCQFNSQTKSMTNPVDTLFK
jgi:hypothetical protein